MSQYTKAERHLFKAPKDKNLPVKRARKTFTCVDCYEDKRVDLNTDSENTGKCNKCLSQGLSTKLDKYGHRLYQCITCGEQKRKYLFATPLDNLMCKQCLSPKGKRMSKANSKEISQTGGTEKCSINMDLISNYNSDIGNTVSKSQDGNEGSIQCSAFHYSERTISDIPVLTYLQRQYVPQATAQCKTVLPLGVENQGVSFAKPFPIAQDQLLRYQSLKPDVQQYEPNYDHLMGEPKRKVAALKKEIFQIQACDLFLSEEISQKTWDTLVKHCCSSRSQKIYNESKKMNEEQSERKKNKAQNAFEYFENPEDSGDCRVEDDLQQLKAVRQFNQEYAAFQKIAKEIQDNEAKENEAKEKKPEQEKAKIILIPKNDVLTFANWRDHLYDYNIKGLSKIFEFKKGKLKKGQEIIYGLLVPTNPFFWHSAKCMIRDFSKLRADIKRAIPIQLLKKFKIQDIVFLDYKRLLLLKIKYAIYNSISQMLSCYANEVIIYQKHKPLPKIIVEVAKRQFTIDLNYCLTRKMHWKTAKKSYDEKLEHIRIQVLQLSSIKQYFGDSSFQIQHSTVEKILFYIPIVQEKLQILGLIAKHQFKIRPVVGSPWELRENTNIPEELKKKLVEKYYQIYKDQMFSFKLSGPGYSSTITAECKKVQRAFALAGLDLLLKPQQRDQIYGRKVPPNIFKIEREPTKLEEQMKEWDKLPNKKADLQINKKD